MRWYAELAVESLLFAILWYRAAPRWFSVLIGVDCVAQLLQIVFYRAHYVEFAHLFWRGGVILVAIFRLLALVELNTVERTLRNLAHACILAFWTAVMTPLALFQVAQPDQTVYLLNNVILCVQLVCFAAWIVLFSMLSTDT